MPKTFEKSHSDESAGFLNALGWPMPNRQKTLSEKAALI